MNIELEDVHKYVPSEVASDEMNWDAYAEHYDQMCKFNPPYQENIQRLVSYLAEWSLPAKADICDLGAGTGNYILEVAKHLPDANYVHVDFDSKMNDLAWRKYRDAEVRHVQLVTEYAQECDFPPESFDLLICVNALYAISPQEAVLKNMNSWLKPDGRFFIIDFGRKQRTLEWTLYLFRESLKNNRAGEYVKTLLDAREVLKQNRKSTKGQESGRYWLHSTDAFGKTLSECGYTVDDIYPCYRDYADLAICRKTN
jgi:ubiquinone/menaquinone biosynthesis C-methylase UbiE